MQRKVDVGFHLRSTQPTRLMFLSVNWTAAFQQPLPLPQQDRLQGKRGQRLFIFIKMVAVPIILTGMRVRVSRAAINQWAAQNR